MQSPLGLQSQRQAECGRGFGSDEPFITRDCLFHRQWEGRQGYKQNCNRISSYTPCGRFCRRWEGTKDKHLGSTDMGMWASSAVLYGERWRKSMSEILVIVSFREKDQYSVTRAI